MNKLKLLGLITISFGSLAACGVDNTEKEAQQTTSAQLVESEASSVDTSEEVENNLVTEGPLLEVGQYINDEYYGRLELEKIASPGNPVEVAPGVTVTFGDVKIINFTDIPQEAQEDANLLYGFEGSQGYDLQFEYTVENNNDFKIDNAAIEKVILSDGEQIERYMYANEAFDLEAGSKASNQIGHVAIPNSDVSSVKFYINPANYDTYDSLNSQPVEVSFE